MTMHTDLNPQNHSDHHSGVVAAPAVGRTLAATVIAMFGLCLAGAVTWTVVTSITRSEGGLISAVGEMAVRPAMVLAVIFSFVVSLVASVRAAFQAR